MLNKILIFLLLVISCHAGMTSVDKNFLTTNDNLLNNSFDKATGGISLGDDYNVTEFNQAKQNIINEVSQKVEMSLLNNSFSMENYKKMINDAFAKNMANIKSNATKQKLSISQSNINSSFTCVCASSLSKAFKNINSHLLDDNLEPLDDSLDSLIDAIKESIEQIEENKKNLDGEVARLKLLLLKTDEYLFKLQQKTGMVKKL